MRCFRSIQFKNELLTVLFLVLFIPPASIANDDNQASPLITFTARSHEKGETKEELKTVKKNQKWLPQKTAVIICDMWDKHWCKGANQRVAEMIPQVNKLTTFLRKQGCLIIHAPSGTMDFYKDTPQRKHAQNAPKAEPPVPIAGWNHLEPEYEGQLPIDDSDGGCDCEPQCKTYSAWKSQHPDIKIAEQDAISDSGQEIYNLMAQHHIDNVIMLGVHTNMCVLGRPFGIRQMHKLGKNVVLVRDLTDTMYNHRMSPYVPHEKGTELVIKHVETYWAPSVESKDLMD